ncbi:MAG: hypothetical protein AABX07_05455 [Nanoarchaeota archaeon]
MKSFKHFELELLKVEKVSRHFTRIRGRIYDEDKFYFSNTAWTGKILL